MSLLQVDAINVWNYKGGKSTITQRTTLLSTLGVAASQVTQALDGNKENHLALFFPHKLVFPFKMCAYYQQTDFFRNIKVC